MSGRAAIWLVGVAVALSAVFALLSGSRTPSPVRRGVRAPAFELPQVGSSSSLNLEQLRGKVVLIIGFEPEITAKVVRIPGVRVYEVGISYAGRTYQEGKKIGWRDGVRAVWCIIKYNILR